MSHDLKIWFKYEWRKYIPVIILFLCAAFSANFIAKEHGMTANVADYLVMMFKGRKPYDSTDTIRNMITFRLPVYYLLFNAYVSWIISYYPFRDVGNYGKLLMMKQGNKRNWWFGKCLWNICTVFSIYLTGYVVFIVFGLFNKSVSMDINLKTLSLVTDKMIDETNLMNLSKLNLIIMCIILPVLISMAVSIFQMLFSLATEPVYGQMAVIFLLVVSAYYCNGLLPGNYMMLLRNSTVIGDNGVNSYFGIITSIITIISGVVLGLRVIRKKDII